MKSLFLGLVVVAASAFATTVTFDTNNSGTSFSCSGYSGTGSCAFDPLTPYVVQVDDLILTYSPNSGSVVAPPSTSIGAGDIVASCALGATCGAFADFSGVTFTLDIKETGDVTGDAVFNGALSGQQNIDSGIIRILLNPPTQTLSSGATFVSFTPDQPIPGYSINPVSDNKTTTVQVLVDSVTRDTVPEPSSMALLASGLIGLGLVARRRK